MLLTACNGNPVAETTGNDETENTTDGITSEGGDETTADDGIVRLYLPRPYIDIEFNSERGFVKDRMNNVSCMLADTSRGNVVKGDVSFGGKTYETDMLRITSAGGALRLTYKNISDMYDLYEILMGGFTLEAFLVNHTVTNADSKEQCMIASTQSGGYNFTTIQGQYAASVHTDGAYHAAKLPGAYDTENLTHLLNVYDPSAGTVSLYVNGELVASSPAPGLLGLATGDCYKTIVIGGDIGNNDALQFLCSDFTLTDFKLYRTPLSESQAELAFLRASSELTGEPLEGEILESNSEFLAEEVLFQSYFDSFAMNVYQPRTPLVNPPTVLYPASADVAGLKDAQRRPATVIFDAALENGVLIAKTAKGETIGTMHDAVKSLSKRAIPAFRFSNKTVGDALVAFINGNNIADCFLISADGALLQSCADATFSARPLLDCTALTEIDAEQIFLDTAKRGVKTILLPASILTPEGVTALRAHSVNVVAVLKGTGVGEIHNAVHTAVSGLVTEDYEAVFDYYESLDKRTLGITPLVVAHRGDPESHPDNLLRSLISAAQSGAISIEFDVWLTKDNHLVLNHDSKTTSYNESLTCTESTRAELEALTYTGKHAQAGDKIAFLDEVFAVFSKQYTDKVLTIEVKDARQVTIDRIIALAKEYGVTDQIVLIGMNHLISNYTYSKYGLGCNMNQSYLVKPDNPERSVMLGAMESTILHSACFTTHANEDATFMKLFYHRLIKYSTWTSTTYAATMQNYLCGAVEYTSNYPHAVDDFYRYLKTEYDASTGKVTVLAVTYAGKTVDITSKVSLVVLDGAGEFANGVLTGSGTFAFRVKCTVEIPGSGESGATNEIYYLYAPCVTR